MIRQNAFFFLFLMAHFFGLLHAQTPSVLVINEISQGASGAQEYIELLVAGTPSCQGDNCKDLRGIIIDDNNGFYGSGSGTGIAQGAVRFSNDPFWSCVPYGTLITFYNDLDVNPSMPPIDTDASDYTLTLPISSSLMDGHEFLPSASSAIYASTGWVNAGALWQYIGMSNASDAFQIIENGVVVSSVSWGTNLGGQIQFFTPASGLTFYNAANDFSAQNAWHFEPVASSESPSDFNSSANQSWIEQMRETPEGPELTLLETLSDCNGLCNGSLSLEVQSSAAYQVYWSNGQVTEQIDGLCAGTYSVSATDALGCEQIDSFLVESSALHFQTQVTNQHQCASACDASIALQVDPLVNVFWADGVTAFNRTDLCADVYRYTLTDQNGCMHEDSVTITASLPPVFTTDIQPTDCFSSNGEICLGLDPVSSSLFMEWSSGAQTPCVSQLESGSYTVSLTDDSGCVFQHSYHVPLDSPLVDDFFIDQTTGCAPHPFSIPNNLPENTELNWDLPPGVVALNDSEFVAYQNVSDILMGELQIGLCTLDVQTVNALDVVEPPDLEISYQINDLQPQDVVFTARSNWEVELDSFGVDGFIIDQSLTEFSWRHVFDSSGVYNACVYAHSNRLGCPTSACAEVYVDRPKFYYYLPNAFSPNQNTVNETFGPKITSEKIQDYVFKIFDRWGGLVFISRSAQVEWQGQKQFTTDQVPQGMYLWTLEFTEEQSQTWVQDEGFVFLIR